jgi:predicted dehydrogenase
MALRAVVIGTGDAGEGHTNALRKSAVDVVALCGRTPEPARAMATKLGIKDVRFDWRQALDEIRPDIVSLATPGRPHQEMAETAASLGCHIFCDKPLTLSAHSARSMLQAVTEAGVKHAYGSSARYAPAIRHARTLIADGLIGPLRQIESVLRVELPATAPFCWIHDLSLGGGLLNNLFTHVVGQVLYLSCGRITAATGEARCLFGKVPVGDTIHHFSDLFSNLVKIDKATQWREADADSGYTILTRIQDPDGHNLSASFHAGSRDPNPGHLSIHGETGSLRMIGSVTPGSGREITYCKAGGSEWDQMNVPDDVFESFAGQESVQGRWDELFREFVDDIKGQGHASYPTFYDGLLHAELIDIARNRTGWQEIADCKE